MCKIDESVKFAQKFKELNPENQRYIIGVQQALVFAQASIVREPKEDCGNRIRHEGTGRYKNT